MWYGMRIFSNSHLRYPSDFQFSFNLGGRGVSDFFAAPCIYNPFSVCGCWGCRLTFGCFVAIFCLWIIIISLIFLRVWG